MIRKTFLFIFAALLMVLLVAAVNFNPQGDIDLKNRYNLVNGGNLTVQRLYMTNSPAACPAGYFLTFWNGTTGLCALGSSSLTANNTGNFSNVWVGNTTSNGEGTYNGYKYNCTQRPLTSNTNITVNVPADVPTIQQALCNVPYFLRHTYVIYVDGATYTANENVTFSMLYGSDDFKLGQLRIRGVAASPPPKVGWFYFSDIMGQGNPEIQHINFTRGSSVYDGCQLCLFSTIQADVIEDYFDCDIAQKTPRNCSAEYGGEIRFGILGYGGTVAKINGAHFYNKTQWGIGAKQGANFWVRDNSADGFTTGQPYYATIGNIYVYGGNVTGDTTAAGSKVNTVVLNQGIIQITNVSDGSHNVVYGITELPYMERLQVGTADTEWGMSNYRGFSWRYDVNTRQMIMEKKDSSTPVDVWEVNRSNNYMSFNTDTINIATALTGARSAAACYNTGDFAYNSTHIFVCISGTWKKAAIS